MKTKKIPMRMCTGCGEAGRGAYVCKNAECLKKARKKRAFERAFSMQIDDEVYNKMEEEIENA